MSELDEAKTTIFYSLNAEFGKFPQEFGRDRKTSGFGVIVYENGDVHAFF